MLKRCGATADEIDILYLVYVVKAYKTLKLNDFG